MNEDKYYKWIHGTTVNQPTIKIEESQQNLTVELIDLWLKTIQQHETHNRF